MTVDPKVSAILNIIVAILGTVLSFSAEFTTLFGAGQAQQVLSWVGAAAMVLGAINTTLHGVSAPKPGPLVAADTHVAVEPLPPKGPPNA